MLCDQNPETMNHLLVDCPFARQVWHNMLAWADRPLARPTSPLVFWIDGHRLTTIHSLAIIRASHHDHTHNMVDLKGSQHMCLHR